VTEHTHDLVRSLEEQRRYYETLIEVSPIAIITGDPDLTVTSWNPAAEELFGYTRDEAIGRPINDLVARSDDIRDEAVAVDHQLFQAPTRLAAHT
jgi:PAS domain S-box-containing protein